MRIANDFGDRADAAIARIEAMLVEFQRVYKEPASPRIIRCVLHLSSGNLDSLDRHIDACLTDYRDIILWAEYDIDGNRVFSGSEHFR